MVTMATKDHLLAVLQRGDGGVWQRGRQGAGGQVAGGCQMSQRTTEFFWEEKFSKIL